MVAERSCDATNGTGRPPAPLAADYRKRRVPAKRKEGQVGKAKGLKKLVRKRVSNRRWVGSWVEERASGGGQSRFKTPLPRGPLRAASPLPSATYPPLRSGAFRQRPSCERSPHFTNLGRWLGHWRAPSGRGLRPWLPSLHSARLARRFKLATSSLLCRHTGRVTAAKPPKEKRGGFLPSKLGENLHPA